MKEYKTIIEFFPSARKRIDCICGIEEAALNHYKIRLFVKTEKNKKSSLEKEVEKEFVGCGAKQGIFERKRKNAGYIQKYYYSN